MSQPPTLLGIRHHGPGSARSVQHALAELQPDAILIEGPPDAQELLSLAHHTEMQPPVALLIYRPEDPQQAVYYPFAEFSPEWQAIQYGLKHGVLLRFMDLPQAHRLTPEATEKQDEISPEIEKTDSPKASAPTPAIRQDPLNWIAEATGYGDGERWWEHMIEQRRDSQDLFQAVLELMTVLREETANLPLEPLEACREAFMRRTIRQTQQAGYQRIAVICGAWHVPALAKPPPVKDDNALLKGLPKVKVTATWVPWTYGRLTYASGYGAGIEAPGFYHHCWMTPDQVSVHWLSRVAQLLREHDLSASTASVIEAVRLAESLAALRNRSQPDLADLNEAALAVFCSGAETPLMLIKEKLMIGERLGQVPAETPMLPLQQDLQRQQKRLRLSPEAGQRLLELDLRKTNDLERSRLLHRLNLLNISWGRTERVGGKGTFKENWRLQWQPELAVALIEANVWGNTVADAAANYAQVTAQGSVELPELTRLAEQVLIADLPAVISPVMTRLQNVAALTSDIPHLMEALPPLVDTLRYGNVRQTDTALVAHIVDGLVTRICIGLPGACASLDDNAAQAMFARLEAVNSAINVLQNEEQLEYWRALLLRLTDQQGLHGLLAGRCCRLLFERSALDADQVGRRLNWALSTANEPSQAAAWIEGFLRGSGLILLHNETLWHILHEWVIGLRGDLFVQLLPLLRRTFATFAAPERRQMGERVRGTSSSSIGTVDTAIDQDRADRVLPLAMRLLGLA
ncbi:MAG: hypothetical protein HC808_17580 [Candidatus Competibacteraceae bacterium]|nr:hypothetical protein [Candidatus Competibacteraceae bacterium]